jgi:hypothetical protein
MSGMHYLKLTPVEGKQTHLASEFVGTATDPQHSPTLRRKMPVTDLKTKAQHDGAATQFLKLTRDPPKNITGTNLTGPGTVKAMGDEEVAKVNNSRIKCTYGLYVARVKDVGDGVERGIQVQGTFNGIAKTTSEVSSEHAKESLTAWTKTGKTRL